LFLCGCVREKENKNESMKAVQSGVEHNTKTEACEIQSTGVRETGKVQKNSERNRKGVIDKGNMCAS